MPPPIQNPASAAEPFYDEFGAKLIADYLKGNPRTSAAIEFAVSSIPTWAMTMLEIGCGIGWAAAEMKRHHPHLAVEAVDISQELLNLAAKLFGDHSIAWKKMDITTWRPDAATPRYDGIMMLDVYEHIPKQSRPLFADALKRCLKPRSFLLLTCPTVMHQQFLRTQKPAGLQPVDEDVQLSDVAELAKHLGMDVTEYRYVSIWNRFDYFHARLEAISGLHPRENPGIHPTLEDMDSRRRRVTTQFADFPLPPKEVNAGRTRSR